MPFTAEKLCTLFLKKEEKNLNLEFIFGIGANEVRQMDREGEAQKNTVVLFHVLLFLHKSGEHSAETLNINIYLLMQWSDDKVAEVLYNIIYECNEAKRELQRLYIILMQLSRTKWQQGFTYLYYKCNEAKTIMLKMHQITGMSI